MEYVLVKIRVYMLGVECFVVNMYLAPLLAAGKTPHSPQKMDRWIFSLRNNFVEHYKPGKINT
ncbi:hypothetical protein Plhal304r1_c063g0151021 [Plasmopara halstedii]